MRHFWELVVVLTNREIKARYKQSVLGYAWVILNPLIQMSVMSFVFSHILRFGELGVPYSVFLYAGLLPWTLFANSLTTSTNALVNNATLLSKIYFPREIFIVSTIMSKIVDFLLASTVFVVFLWASHVIMTLNILWVIPIFIIQLIFTFGISLILAAFNLFYRDIQYLISLILLVWMYLTPVIYPTEMFPEKYKFIFQMNPMAVLINAYRQVILAGEAPNYMSLGIALIVSVIIMAIGYRIFKKLEGVFADVV